MLNSKSKDTLPPLPSSSSSRLLGVRKPLELFQGIVRSTRRFLVTMNLRGVGNRQARTSKKRATIPPGQSELEQLLALAEYELEHDPYRGIGITENFTAPWNQCTWGMLQEDLTNTKDLSPQVVLRHVCQCACPSLIAWTKQQQNKRNKNKSKKRSRNDSNRDIFQVGGRGVNAVCICDFNPLCLGSLGGLINDILQERSEQVLVAYELDKLEHKETPLPSQPPPASKHPKVIDLDADTTQSTATSLSEEKDPLEFTGQDEVISTTKVELLAIAPPPFQTKKRDSSLENPNLVFTKEHSASLAGQIITYSKTTQESLDRLRRSLPVQDAPIRSYIYRTLQIDHINDSNYTLDKYVQKLRQWHKSLLFVNPMKDDDNNNSNSNAASNSTSNRLSISIPPGIQNLGATCYLNTQLQCLAQNTAFLQGIFSWRQATSSDEHGSMNSVMSKLQYLLAQMVVGGDNKLSTLDFSNALGLEHDEQQDPNEFARLLFQRMDESFNNCGDSNLSNLLQRLFHGVTTYETTCMTCQATSARQEGFMDLNLPIVQETTNTAKTATKTGGGGQISILEALKGTKDTNVQFCLDQYTCAEMLDGDNQYHCSSCNAKRDVQRVLKFTELPPVLNVQLSRYVFDREKCVKKKLTDKVLLPTVLNASKKRYLLCAVMRHQGTSAYRGHYVAEAMDWLTGQWFEFNDATVKLLPDGPSCSYDPSLAEGETTTKKRLEGSQDAYNMYYVEDSFLAKHATSSLLKREQLLERVNNSSSQADDVEESKDVLVKVAKQRDTKYAVLSELCFTDWRKCDRLNRRRVGIGEFMFPGAASLAVVENGQNGKKNEPPVWVDGAPLRTFLCCSEELDQHLSDSGPLLRHKHLLCPHGCLHPRMARRGKLLPRPIYDAYVFILQGERALLRQGLGETDADMVEANDCLVTRESHLHCQECSKSYRYELSKKLDLVKDLKFLYEELDPKADDFSSEYEVGDLPLSPEDEYAYAISKGFITKFRKAVVGMMKSLHNLDEGTILSSQDNGSHGTRNVVYEGLDAVDTSMFEFEPTNEHGERILSLKSESCIRNDDKLNEEVNGIITCSHGKCNLFRNKRLVRFVHWSVWSTLKKIFPRAIEHKEKRTLASGDNSSEDNGCPECEVERASKDLLRTELENWATETKENFDLKVLYGGKSAISREKEVHNFTNGKNGVRLVHGADIKTWRKAVSTLADPSKIEATDTATLKAVVEDIAFPSYHRVVLEFERLPVERLLSSLRSLICGEHKYSIKCAVFQDLENPPMERDSHKKQLAKNITVLSDDEYRAYIASLAGLLRILNTEDSFIGSVGSPVVIDDVKKHPTFLKEIRQVTESYHPTIRLHADDDNDKPGNSLAFSLDGSDKVFGLNPRLCVCETCKKEFAPLLELDAADSASVDEKLERVSVDANGSVSSVPTGGSKHGSAAADPILVESDHDDGADALPNTFDLRVFEISRNASIEEVTNSLQSVTAITSEAEPSSLSNFIRRSTRKRKSKYPSGCLLSEDTVKVSLYHNIAALRLRLYEKCEVGLSGNKLILVVLGEDGKLAESLEIQFDWGPKQLSELVDDVKARTKIVCEDFEPAASLILLHQKQNEVDSSSLHETVMDSLLEIANLDPSGPTGNNNNEIKRINNRPAERGFRGTLLSSGSAPKNDQNEEVVEKKAISDAYAVSDEDKDDSCAVVEDSPPKKASLLSDSSSEDELPPSAFSPKDTNKRKREYQEAPKGPKVIVENDSSEDERRAVCSLQGLPVSGSENSVDSSRRRRASQKAADDVLTEEVVAALQKIVAQPAEVVKSWDAASWAIMQNPSIKGLDGLVDIAFAKYLENQG